MWYKSRNYSRLWQRVAGSLIIVGVITLSGPISYSAKDNHLSEGVPFTFTNFIPKNQLSVGNYFDLLMEPGQKQQLITELTNLSDKDLEITVSLHNATTTSAGKINYGPSEKGPMDILKAKVTDVVDVPEKLVIPKYSRKPLKLNVTMPKNSIEGVLMGGVHLKVSKMSQETSKKDVVSLENEYAYLYSISLREDKEEGNVEIKSSRSSYESTDDSANVSVGFQNTSSYIVRNMAVSVDILLNGTDEIIEHKVFSDMKMAPQSSIDIPVAVKPLEKGKYQSIVTVTIGREKWKWSESFVVSNRRDVSEEKENYNLIKVKKETINWLVIIGIVVSIIAVTVVIYQMLFQKNNKGRL